MVSPLSLVEGHRGVVAACSYETRAYGVHSAMPMKTALQLCPEALVTAEDMQNYIHYSKLITEIIRSESPIFEKASVD
jgi:DNA polymerase-4